VQEDDAADGLAVGNEFVDALEGAFLFGCYVAFGIGVGEAGDVDEMNPSALIIDERGVWDWDPCQLPLGNGHSLRDLQASTLVSGCCPAQAEMREFLPAPATPTTAM
jgi:hypothetical protein